MTSTRQNEEIKKTVREGYADIARSGGSCCGPQKSCCSGEKRHETISRNVGYSDEDMKSVPEGANLGLGCGNPIALASLKEGETVLDLGSGGGFDCFLAAQAVGSNGRVIGVDMTPEMIAKAKNNAEKGGYKNVEFRLGEIEDIPVDDSSVDIVISNCVINLSPDKPKVFKETYRVLKPGGRLMVSDIVVLGELPDAIRKSVSAYVGCISGALMKEKYLKTVRDAGFKNVEVLDEAFFKIDCMLNDPTAKAIINKSKLSEKDLDELNHLVASIKVRGLKT